MDSNLRLLTERVTTAAKIDNLVYYGKSIGGYSVTKNHESAKLSILDRTFYAIGKLNRHHCQGSIWRETAHDLRADDTNRKHFCGNV